MTFISCSREVNNYNKEYNRKKKKKNLSLSENVLNISSYFTNIYRRAMPRLFMLKQLIQLVLLGDKLDFRFLFKYFC